MEGVKHFMCRCVFVAEERREMARLMNEIEVRWESMEDDERVIWVLEEACRDGGVWKVLQRMWRKWTSCSKRTMPIVSLLMLCYIQLYYSAAWG